MPGEEMMHQVQSTQSHLDLDIMEASAKEREQWASDPQLQADWMEMIKEAGITYEPFSEEEMSNEPFNKGNDNLDKLSRALRIRADQLAREMRLPPAGILRYPAGNPKQRKQYSGQLDPKKPRPHGIGVMEWDREAANARGPTCEGQWVHDKPEGFAIYTWPSGNVYEGQFKHGRKAGKGVMTIVDGEKSKSTYEGDWERNEAYGEGIFKSANGDIYTGDFVLNMKQGSGKMLYANGSCYEGTYLQDLREGQGVMTTSNGDVYEGGWKADKFHGYGKLVCKDGHVYEGMHEHGVSQGLGSLSYPPALNAGGDKLIVKKVKGTWDKGILKIIDRITEEESSWEGTKPASMTAAYPDTQNNDLDEDEGDDLQVAVNVQMMQIQQQ